MVLLLNRCYGPAYRGIPSNLQLTFVPIGHSVPSLAPSLHQSNAPSGFPLHTTPTASPSRRSDLIPSLAPSLHHINAPSVSPSLKTPTVSPSIWSIVNHPTYLPTHPLEVVSWKMSLTIFGVTSDELDFSAKTAFVNVNSRGMGDVYEDIVILSVQDSNLSNDAKGIGSKFLREEYSQISHDIGANITFKAQYICNAPMNDFEVYEMIDSYRNKAVNLYSNASTSSSWVKESVLLGSTTIDLSTQVKFGTPHVNYSSVDIQRNGQNSNSQDEQRSVDTTVIISAVVGAIVVLVFCTTCCVFMRNRAKRSSKSDYKSNHSDTPSNIVRNPLSISAYPEEDFEDATSGKRKNSPNSSLLSKVKSNKDRIMRTKKNRYAKL